MQYGNFNTASGIIQKQSFLMVATIAFIALFQYRKRYGPVATLAISAIMITGVLFQYHKRYGPVATKCMNDIIDAAKTFQYRKRYYPVATKFDENAVLATPESFNTASGITQLQHKIHDIVVKTTKMFQYRKRYYPVATQKNQ